MPEQEVRFPTAAGAGEVRGILHAPSVAANLAVVLAHGRSGDMGNRLLRRLAAAACDVGWLALRFNFRYVDAKRTASRDLSAEADDLLGAVRFLRRQMSVGPVLVAGASMGARVCARACADLDVAGVIALGYPLHPMFKPQVRDPPEWTMIAKPALFVQGNRDPFCDLPRLREELPRLTQPHELVVIPDAGHVFEPKGTKRDTFPEVWGAVAAWVRRQVA